MCVKKIISDNSVITNIKIYPRMMIINAIRIAKIIRNYGLHITTRRKFYIKNDYNVAVAVD